MTCDETIASCPPLSDLPDDPCNEGDCVSQQYENLTTTPASYEQTCEDEENQPSASTSYRWPELSALKKRVDKAVESGKSTEQFDFENLPLIITQEYLEPLERLAFYARQANQIRKEAVQNAVDIVQSKRLDFLDVNDVDWKGIVISALLVAAIEFGAVGFAASVTMSGLAKALSIVGAKVPRAKALSGALKVAATKSRSDHVLIQLEEQFVSYSLKRSRKQLVRVGKAQLDFKKEVIRTVQRQAKATLHIMNKKEGVDRAKAFAKVGKELTAWKLVKLAKEEESLQEEILKRAPEREVKTQIGRLHRSNAPKKEGKLATEFGVLHYSIDPIPMDVYLKSWVQSEFDDSLMRLDNIVRELNATVRRLSLMNGPVSAGDLKDLFDVLELLPDAELVEEANESWEELLQDTDTLRWNATAEYELFIWAFLLGPRIVFQEVPAHTLQDPALDLHMLRIPQKDVETWDFNADGIKMRASFRYLGKRYFGKEPVSPQDYREIGRMLHRVHRVLTAAQEIVQEIVDREIEIEWDPIDVKYESESSKQPQNEDGSKDQ